jgi:hypothetical protein
MKMLVMFFSKPAARPCSSASTPSNASAPAATPAAVCAAERKKLG